MICWFENHCNTVECNRNFVYLLSSKSSRKSGFCVEKGTSMRKMLCVFSARSLIRESWIIDQNRYLGKGQC
jgi:hypothetical protein